MFATAAAIFSVLLIVTGVAKVARPEDVTKALVALGVPRLPGAGLLIGLLEVAVGAAALLFPTMLFIQAAAYLVFAGWVTAALRSGVPIASCGCLGRDDTPPTLAHVVMNVVAAVVSFGAAFGEGLVLEPVLQGLAQLTIVAVGVFLSYVVLNQAAWLVGVRRS